MFLRRALIMHFHSANCREMYFDHFFPAYVIVKYLRSTSSKHKVVSLEWHASTLKLIALVRHCWFDSAVADTACFAVSSSICLHIWWYIRGHSKHWQKHLSFLATCFPRFIPVLMQAFINITLQWSRTAVLFSHTT